MGDELRGGNESVILGGMREGVNDGRCFVLHAGRY